MSPGDDCALLTLPPTLSGGDTDTLVTALLLSRHGSVDGSGVNLSDLAAMGAEPPLPLSLALTLPAAISECRRHGFAEDSRSSPSTTATALL